MKAYTVAVLGATGLVGREMLRMLQQRNFPVERLVPLAGSRSAGTMVEFQGEKHTVREAAAADFSGIDLVLGAASADVARELAPKITRSGAIFVDNSSAFRLTPDVPLVVPAINPEDVREHHGIISNPNCTTIIALTAVAPLRPLGRICSIWAASYQAVSGAGAAGVQELVGQSRALLSQRPYPPQAFTNQIAFNLIPHIGQSQLLGYTDEEMKLQNEGRKILHEPELNVCCTCVRVPVMRSHSVAISVGFDRAVQVDEARALLSRAPQCVLLDLPGEYPMPLLSSDSDEVLVGRLRPDLTDECRLALFCCGDQVRRGAATNAVQIAELLL